MRKIISIILLIFGFFGLAYTGYSYLDAQKKSNSIVLEFENKIQSNKDNEKVSGVDNNTSTSESDVNEPSDTHDIGKLPLNSIVGIVEIPKLDIQAPLVEGQNEKLLRYGVGRVENSALPGADGNFVVGGHRNALYSSYFRYLHKLSKGDLIHITTLEGVYTYKVTETLTVTPKDVWVMNETNTPTITLITCTTDRAHRTIVFGEKISN